MIYLHCNWPLRLCWYTLIDKAMVLDSAVLGICPRSSLSLLGDYGDSSVSHFCHLLNRGNKCSWVGNGSPILLNFSQFGTCFLSTLGWNRDPLDFFKHFSLAVASILCIPSSALRHLQQVIFLKCLWFSNLCETHRCHSVDENHFTCCWNIATSAVITAAI